MKTKGSKIEKLSKSERDNLVGSLVFDYNTSRIYGGKGTHDAIRLLAKERGYTQKEIRGLLNSADQESGMFVRSYNVSKNEADAISYLHSEGRSTKEISEMLGRSASTVRKYTQAVKEEEKIAEAERSKIHSYDFGGMPRDFDFNGKPNYATIEGDSLDKVVDNAAISVAAVEASADARVNAKVQRKCGSFRRNVIKYLGNIGRAAAAVGFMAFMGSGAGEQNYSAREHLKSPTSNYVLTSQDSLDKKVSTLGFGNRLTRLIDRAYSAVKDRVNNTGKILSSIKQALDERAVVAGSAEASPLQEPAFPQVRSEEVIAVEPAANESSEFEDLAGRIGDGPGSVQKVVYEVKISAAISDFERKEWESAAAEAFKITLEEKEANDEINRKALEVLQAGEDENE